MVQRQSHSEAGLLYTHRKRKFGVDDEPSPAPVDVDEHTKTLDFVELADQLIHNADAVEDGVDSEDEQAEMPLNQPSPVAVPPLTLTSCTSQHSKPKGILLKDLFSFMDPQAQSKLQFYWKAGLRNLKCETVILDSRQAGSDTSAPEMESQRTLVGNDGSMAHT